MIRCSASEFCTQVFTFKGNRLLVVTTVHFGASRVSCTRTRSTDWLCGCAMEKKNMRMNSKLHSYRCYSTSPRMKPLQRSPNLPGLVDPPCHAQEVPHLLEGNRCVPAADSVGTVQTQQVQASLANRNKRLRGVNRENSRGLEQ